MSERETTPMPIGNAGQPGLAIGPRLVVLFGGTFDPPHRGHVELPVRVRDELERRAGCVGEGWLVYVPAARSPHKERGPVVSDADRVEMLGRAIAGVPRAGVWTEEIDRARAQQEAGGDGRDARATEPSFTVETVRRARRWLDRMESTEAEMGGSKGEELHAERGGTQGGETHAERGGTQGEELHAERGGTQEGKSHAERGGIELRLLIGADQAVGFHRWKEPLSIVRLAKPAVMVRGEVADSDDLARRLKQNRFWKREDLEGWRGAMVEVGRMDVSATRVRDALRSGDGAEVERWLAPGVAAYIREHGLYAASDMDSR